MTAFAFPLGAMRGPAPTYGIEVKCRTDLTHAPWEWRLLRPSPDKLGYRPPYMWPTEIKAQRVLNMCYPDQTPEFVRVAKC